MDDAGDRFLGSSLAASHARLRLHAVPVADDLAALDGFGIESVPNASGLFNLMRNLGGAIGLALIDTVIANRTPIHVDALVAHLEAGDSTTASFIGLPVEQFSTGATGLIDPTTRDLIAPLLERAGLTEALNDAWLVIGGFVLLSLLMLPLLRPVNGANRQSDPSPKIRVGG
jgi:DHA2 family multidrug resistance protein